MNSMNAGEYNVKLNGNQNNEQKMNNEAGDAKTHKKKDNTATEIQVGESSLPRRRPGPRSRLRSIPTPTSPSKTNDKASTEVRNNTSNGDGETTKAAIPTPVPALQNEKGTRQGLRSKNSAASSTSGKTDEKNDLKSLPTSEEAEKGKKTDEVLNKEHKKSDNAGTEPVHARINEGIQRENVSVVIPLAENNFDLSAIQSSQTKKSEEGSQLSEKVSGAIAARAPLDSSVTIDASQPVEHHLSDFNEGKGISDTITSPSIYGLSPRSSINTQSVFYAGVSADSPLFPAELGTKRKAPIHSFEEMTDEYIPPKRQAAPTIQPVRNSMLWRLVTNNPVRYLFVSNDVQEVATEIVEIQEEEPTLSETENNEPGMVSDEGIVEDDVNISDAGTPEVEVNVVEEEVGGGNRRRRFCSVM